MTGPASDPSPLAVVAVFGYNRPGHLRRTLSTLARCQGANRTRVILFLDGPPEDASRDELERIGEVREVARAARGFGAVDVRAAPRNRGLYRSIREGVSRALEEHPRVVVLEDDLECHPRFLAFMNDGLERLAGCERVHALSGYAYPHHRFWPRRRSYFLRAFSSLGWATWRDRWPRLSRVSEEAERSVAESALERFRFDILGSREYARMLEANRDAGDRRSWAVEAWLNTYRDGGMVLFPSKALIRHRGYDGSGTNPSGVPPFRDPPLDPDFRPRPPALPPRVRALDQLALAAYFWLNRLRLALRRRVRAVVRSLRRGSP